MRSSSLLALLIGPALLACDSNKPNDVTDMTVIPDLSMSAGDLANAVCAPFNGELSACACTADDYAPRFNQSGSDTWAKCISDDNEFKLAGASPPGSASRTQAFDAMGLLLWKNAQAPSMNDFVDARDAYAINNGIGSRVSRRQDVHYAEVPGATSRNLACTEGNNATMYPDRCAGPAKLVPIINDAFVKGIAMTEPRVQAARIEAALLWFFYISSLSEVWTCSFVDKADCDSAWAYYNAAQTRDKVAGIASYIQALSQETHDRVFDGLLAERCWRDLDQALPSANTVLYDRALKQLDKALLKGVALILRDRIAKVPTTTGEVQKAHLTFVNLLGDWFVATARIVVPGKMTEATALKTQVEKTDPAQVQVKQAQDAIAAIFPCP